MSLGIEKGTFVAANTKHLLQDHKAGRIIIDNQDTEAGRKLVGDSFGGFPDRARTGRRHRSPPLDSDLPLSRPNLRPAKSIETPKIEMAAFHTELLTPKVGKLREPIWGEAKSERKRGRKWEFEREIFIYSTLWETGGERLKDPVPAWSSISLFI